MKLELNNDLLKSLLVMTSMVEARDAYTGGHLWRVSQYSMMLGQKIGFSKEEIFQVGLGGFLHDLGKIGVPDAILSKAGPLTDDEYGVIKTHPGIGGNLMRDHPLAGAAINHIVQHHERPDGKGYPYGLAKDQIPVQSRIVGLVDAFDAMTSTRSYRKGMPLEKALSIIEENRGSQFDTELSDAFVALGRAGGLEHVLGHSYENSALASCPMCGPIVAVAPETKDGDHVFCRSCTGELVVHADGDRFELSALGIMGKPENLTPQIEMAPVNDLTKMAPQSLTIAA
ncbi:MAG: HD domain-containing protein [Alphaproteobacteria bacterium]|nr:HD domain-containing protein [Rhodospirillales bacterium]MCW9045300.1 HD domain-containing protein [Alphaproteobacteria bacterium]